MATYNPFWLHFPPLAVPPDLSQSKSKVDMSLFSLNKSVGGVGEVGGMAEGAAAGVVLVGVLLVGVRAFTGVATEAPPGFTGVEEEHPIAKCKLSQRKSAVSRFGLLGNGCCPWRRSDGGCPRELARDDDVDVVLCGGFVGIGLAIRRQNLDRQLSFVATQQKE
jgi:hypothetical protein